MSQHIHHFDEGTIVYGLDHAIGYFLTVFNYKGDVVWEMETNNPLGDNVHRGAIATFLLYVKAPHKHYHNIFLDLPI